MAGFLNSLRDHPIRPIVLSGNAERTYQAHNLRSIPRRDTSAIVAELRESHALVFAGGSLLQDVTSLASLYYYCNLIRLGKKCGKPVFLLAQGIGPIRSFFGKAMAKSALNLCEVITVRDPDSLQTLRKLGVKKHVTVTADFAWLCPSETTGKEEFGLPGMTSVGIAARPWKGMKNPAEVFGNFALTLFKNNYVPVLIEMDKAKDGELLDAIAKLHGGRCPDIRNLTTPSQLLARIQRLHSMVAMRLHAGILACVAGIPPMMISYDPKISAFAEIMHLPSPLSVQNLTPDRLWNAFQEYEREKDNLKLILEKKRLEQTELARKNVTILTERLPALAG